MNWWIVGLVALIALPLWQIAISIVPIGEYFKQRNAEIEERTSDAEFDRIEAAEIDDE